jgi:DNA-binding Lrp family transcriptional regulator
MSPKGVILSDSEAQLNHIGKLPIAWLSDGVLRTSIFLRHDSAKTGKTSEALDYLLQEKISTSGLLAAFPSLIKPSSDLTQAASDDYSRCILARSVAEVFRKITPNYKNEAARKQFFKKLADIAAAIHLSESNVGLPERLNADSRDDDVGTWVNLELEKLVRQRTDLVAEYSAKLGSARIEFAAALRQLERLVGIAWTESDHYRPSLRISSFFPPGLVENENTWRWGTQWYSQQGVLNLNPPILFIDPIRKGVIVRETASLLAPRNLDDMGHHGLELCEQSEYLAYKLFERKNDREFWAEARHGLRQKTRVRAHELIEFFNYYEMMVGDSLYRELWTRLKEFGDAQLTFSDYLNVFSSLTNRPVNPKFDEEELRLLDLLCKRPDVGAGQAARLLGVSIPTAMKAIRDLSRKAGLSFTILVDMHKIGFTEHLALIQTSKSTKILNILQRFPYCRQVFRTYGSFELFCVLDIPFEHDDFAEKFLNRMTERELVANHKLLQLQRNLQAVNFEWYDAKKRSWDIHWDSWALNLRESLTKPEQFMAERSSESLRTQPDKLDHNILSMLHINSRTPFSVIGRTLGVSGAYVGRRVMRMAQQGLFRYAVWPMKIGAEDWGLLALSCPREIAGTLARSLSRLPAWRGGFVSGAFEGLLAIVWCPNGEMKQFFKAIDDRLVKTGLARAECLNSIGDWAVARWLPCMVDPDDPWKLLGEDGKWMFDEGHYMALVE